MSWQQPTLLNSLSEKDSILDALYRMLLGFDTNDFDMYKSSLRWDENSYMDIKNVSNFKGTEALTDLFQKIAKLNTTHMLSSIRVDQKANDKATVYAYSLNQHFKLTDASRYFLAGLMCRVDVVKEDDLWKVIAFDADSRWTIGDPTVMQN